MKRKDLKPNKRMSSIARRINRSQVWSMLLTLLFINLMIVAALIVGWCYTMEKQALGDSWKPLIKRNIEWLEGLQGRQFIDSIHYVFFGEDGEVYRIAAGGFLKILNDMGILILIGEAIVLIAHWSRGKGRTMRLLSPLHQMSDQAEVLSQISFDQRKYHDLEDAISAISPSKPEARLSMGDSDLLGLENAINNLVTRMHESYRQQVRFVSDASHELRTPIQVIRGYADMLQRWGKADEKVLDESVSAIRDEADNMQQLVEQLLFLARGDAGNNQLKMQQLDLSVLMRDLYEEYQLIDSSHKWRLIAEEPVPAYGDPGMLKQAARILCDNAIKYSPEGETITLRSGWDDQTAPCFSIQDNGSGIPAEDIPHIFERFYRADLARTRQTGGSGLGLSIAKWIVDSHQGYLQVVSREGFGTRMSVCLPKTAPEPQEEARAEEATEEARDQTPVNA